MQPGDFLDFVMRWSGAAGEAAMAFVGLWEGCVGCTLLLAVSRDSQSGSVATLVIYAAGNTATWCP